MKKHELIEAAAKAIGGKSKLAAHLNKAPARVSEWLKDLSTPTDEEVFAMAELAGWPPLQTLCEVRSEGNTPYASKWKETLGKLTAAGVAASFAALLFGLSPDTANARPSQTAEKDGMYIMSTTVFVVTEPHLIDSPHRSPTCVLS